MKNPILILCFLAYSVAICAQNPRIETFGDRRMETYNYQKGGDSIRFTIRGKNDTVQKMKLYRSGKTSEITWQKDSIHEYDVLGRLERKMFGINGNVPNDSTVSFYPTGQIQLISAYKNKNGVVKELTKEGKIVKTTRFFDAPSVYYSIVSDRHNVRIRAQRIDTLVGGKYPKYIKYDTVYFDNGRIFKTSVTNNDYQNLGSQEYNLDGTLSTNTVSTDLKLIEFKDNVDCYYGLKNKRGDTIIKPRFDRFNTFYPNMWGGYAGTSLFLFDEKGAPISTFPANLTYFDRLYPIGKKTNWGNPYLDEKNSNDADISQRRTLIDTTRFLYAFSQGKKNGVVTANGRVILPPQYYDVSRSVLDNTFFQFQERETFNLKKSGFITLDGKPLFSSDDFKTVIYTNYKDYFFLSQKPYEISVGCTGRKSSDANEVSAQTNRNRDFLDTDNPLFNTFGLGKSDGTILLERKYDAIAHIGTSPLFITTLLKEVEGIDDSTEIDDLPEGTDTKTQHNGIYNSLTQRWLLDSMGFEVCTPDRINAYLFVIKQLAKEKYGIMDTTGRYILPLTYDSIGIADANIGLFWVKKGKKYQIFEVKNGKPYLHKTLYDYLNFINFDLRRGMIDENIVYFLAQRNGKWGVMDAAENIIKPFEYDYIAWRNAYDRGFIMVKDNQAEHFTLYSLPNSTNDFPHFGESSLVENQTGSYTLINNKDRFCIINKSGKVIVPPQYKEVSSDTDGDYMLIEDAKKHKKLVFLEAGKQIDYPFDYTLQWASPHSDLIIVQDKAEISYGVVSTEGKVLVPCKNYGVAVCGYGSPNFFVKQDTPIFRRYRFTDMLDNPPRFAVDSLSVEDQNWLMYDSKGTLLTDKPFRYPFPFNADIAIGMMGNDFNLYKTDGSILTPFTKKENLVKNTEGGQNLPNIQVRTPKGFNNIRRDDETGFYALFYNQGLSPTLILTNNMGEIVVNGGRYDGISNIYGKYALVTASDKIGLIDTFGREIIAPQDIRTYAGSLMDSLNVVNKEWYNEWVKAGKKEDPRSLDLPIASNSDCTAYHPDSLAITATQRTLLWNLILDKIRLKTIKTASDICIERIGEKKRTYSGFMSFDYGDKGEIEYRHRKIIVEDKTVSFILDAQKRNENTPPIFYNFYQRNNRWEELQINDLLKIQGDKRWEMNDLITKKVKALKDQQIDCSNASAFITTVENRWMLTKDGIDFCFDSKGKGNFFNQGDYVSISISWAELTPFLKMKIF